MRILAATIHRSIVGGVETYLAELLPALQAAGHELALLHENPLIVGRDQVDGAIPNLPAWCARDIEAAVLLKQIEDWQPSIVYSHGLESPELEQALLEHFPVVLYAHNYHGTCISGTKRLGFPWPQPCDRIFGPLCLLHHLPQRCGGLSPVTMVRHYQQQQHRHQLLPHYRAVLVASTHMQREYLRHGVPTERAHWVPLFPPGSTPLKAPPEPRPCSRTVLMIGRLTDLKGGQLLLRAVHYASWKLEGLKLIVAGEGPELGPMKSLASRLGIHAEFFGWVDPIQRNRLLREADVLAVPSTWPEPFGLVGIEAGCVGLPAVAFGVGGIVDWLKPGISGELAAGTIPTAHTLGNALVRALENPEHLTRLRQGAWETARQYTRENHLARLLPILEEAAVR